jgi:hypothetical protein
VTSRDDYVRLPRTFNEDAKRDDPARPRTKVYGEMSIVASKDMRRLTEPWFNEIRSAYVKRRQPFRPADDEHEEALRKQTRHELGR